MGHFYLKDGTPFYTIESANGSGERETTIRDAKKIGAGYSVTTVTGQINKPALLRWQLDQLLKSTLEVDDSIKILGADIWQSKVWDVYKTNTGTFSQIGNDVHNKLEQYFLTGSVEDIDPHILKAVVDSIDTLGLCLYYPEKSFYSASGFGGKIDLTLTHNDGKVIIVDFKTKSVDSFLNKKGIIDNKFLYEDYSMQLAAYRQGLSEQEEFANAKFECYNLFISVTKPGVVYLHKWSDEELDRSMTMFNHLLSYAKLVNNYDPTKAVVNAN